MPTPQAQVADLIMQLMMRGKSGGLPMQASPELTQYLAHAQAGTVPPQLRTQPPAEVMPGPGSGLREINDPDFLNAAQGQLPDNIQYDANGWPRGTEAFAAPYQGPEGGNVVPGPGAMDMVTDDRLPSQTFRQESYGEFAGEPIFIWYTNPQTGKRIKLDGPFMDDLSARRAFNELRQSGLSDPLEISPY